MLIVGVTKNNYYRFIITSVGQNDRWDHNWLLTTENRLLIMVKLLYLWLLNFIFKYT